MGVMVRDPQWPTLLHETVQAWRKVALIWGQSDCLQFCIACERAMKAGASRFDGLPHYGSEAEAARHLAGNGFISLADAVGSRLAVVPLALAQRGDWVMRDASGVLPGSLGVVLGDLAAHMSQRGLVMLPTLGSIRAWRV